MTTTLALALLLSSASVQREPASRPSIGEADFVFVFLKAGSPPSPLTKEQVQEIQKGHMANIGRLAEQRSLVLAGPFGKDGDAAVRGLFFFDVATLAEAERLTATDPAVQAGTLVFDGYPMRATASLRRIHDLDQADAATRPASGPKFSIREYAFLVVDEAARAELALEPLRREGKVLVFGRLGGAMAGKAIVVLDAKKADAETALAPVKEALGPFTMRTWHATPSLARIHGNPASRPAR